MKTSGTDFLSGKGADVIDGFLIYLASRRSQLPRGPWFSRKPSRYLKAEFIYFKIIHKCLWMWVFYISKAIHFHFRKLRFPKSTQKGKHPQQPLLPQIILADILVFFLPVFYLFILLVLIYIYLNILYIYIFRLKSWSLFLILKSIF